MKADWITDRNYETNAGRIFRVCSRRKSGGLAEYFHGEIPGGMSERIVEGIP